MKSASETSSTESYGSSQRPKINPERIREGLLVEAVLDLHPDGDSQSKKEDGSAF